VNASSLAGELTIAATARGSDAMTITGGTGADTIEMENASDVLTGGAGTVSDEVQLTFSGTGGALIVDLSSTGDQVTMFNGLANSVSQSGFEDLDASSYTQTASVGADITGSSGANVIVGTGYADTIRGGDGADTITGGAGADNFNLTETTSAIDTIILSIASTNGSDTVSSFVAGTDVITMATNEAEDDTTALATFELISTGADDILAAGFTVIDNSDASIANADSLSAADITDRLNDLGNDGNGDANDLIVAYEGAGDENYVAISDGTDTAIVLLTSDADTAIEADEITILLTISGMSDASDLLATSLSDFA
jgi:hypothetical protein